MKNESGIRPVEYKILILPDVVQAKTAGGIFLPDINKDMEQWAQVKGTLIAIGGSAFGSPFSDEERELLVPGARVYCRKYEGINITGADDREYRLCNDKDIGGIVLDEMAASNTRGRNRSGLDAA